MQGRWVIHDMTPGFGPNATLHGPLVDGRVPIPIVPVDDEAIERARFMVRRYYDHARPAGESLGDIVGAVVAIVISGLAGPCESCDELPPDHPFPDCKCHE